MGAIELISLGLKFIDKYLPDPEAKAKAQQEWMQMEHEERIKVLGVTGDIIKAEASSDSWLTSSWRPLTMLTFVGLIVARFFGYTAPGISNEEYLALWELMKLGIGGYLVGRSAEKIAPSFLELLKK